MDTEPPTDHAEARDGTGVSGGRGRQRLPARGSTWARDQEAAREGNLRHMSARLVGSDCGSAGDDTGGGARCRCGYPHSASAQRGELAGLEVLFEPVVDLVLAG